MPIRVRARLACQIAGVNIDRFNEAVAAGVYPCAPPTTKGQPRIFNEADVVSLYVYARLMDAGMNAENAAGIGCKVGGKVANAHEVQKPDAGRIYFVKARNGISWTVEEEKYEVAANNISGSPIVLTLMFDTATILKIIRDEVEDYDSIKGAE